MRGQPTVNTYTPVGNLMVNLDYYWSNQGAIDANGCIPWIGPKHRQSYGMMGGFRQSDEKRIMTVTHRITAMLKYGRALTSTDYVLHTCSNASCVNPDHIIIGDAYDKARIRDENGRGNYHGRKTKWTRRKALVPKKQNRTYKYTEDEIRWIRQATSAEIGAKYGMEIKKASRFRYEVRKRYEWLKD